MSLDDKISAFLAASPFAVVGASANRDKYGNKVLRCYLQNDRPVTAVNPNETEIEGVPCYPSVRDIPEPPGAVSVITPPAVTLQVVEDIAATGAKHVWMQPGAESPESVARAESLGLRVIPGTACLLVVLGYHE